MVVYNYSGKEVNAKIVYYGPALSGKTTNLEWIYSKIPVEYSGKMVSLRTQADRTIFFDFLPLDLGMIDGFRTRFMLYTVPGQVHYNATRKMVLKGVDGLVFVADSEPGRMQDNIESLQNLRDNLTELGLNFDAMPLVLQWNKRDLPNCMSVAELETQLNPRALPTFEACALTGEGVYETLHKVCRSIYTKLTGSQAAAGEEEPSLFGESIAQCLQDVDVPQPEPERVAIGAADGRMRVRSDHDDPLGAILGRGAAESSARGASVRAGVDPPTREIRPLSSEQHRSASAVPVTASPGHSAQDVPASSRDLESAHRIGGLVDEVLSSLRDHDDVASIDRASSRPVSASTPKTSALGERLDHFFEGVETSKPVTMVRPDDPSAPQDSPWARSDMGFDAFPRSDQEKRSAPAQQPTVEEILGPEAASASRKPSDDLSVEHDVDVFEELHRTASGSVQPVPAPVANDGELDLDLVLQEDKSSAQELELITDPRKLPREVSGSGSPVPRLDIGLGGPSRGDGSFDPRARVVEVPLTVDAKVLEEGIPIRVVLNITVAR